MGSSTWLEHFPTNDGKMEIYIWENPRTAGGFASNVTDGPEGKRV